MLIVIILSETMLSVIIESVVMLKVVAAKAGGYTGAPKNVLCRCNKDSFFSAQNPFSNGDATFSKMTLN